MGDGAPLPEWYDDLEGFERACWRMMARGVADRRSPFHTPVLANVTSDGMPEARTLVLRGVEESERRLRFHSDLRASKITALRDRPAVSVVFYDKASKLQIRARGSATVHTIESQIGATAWERTRSFSRECYRVFPDPGSSLDRADAYGHPEADDEGASAFCVISVAVTVVEALFLAAQGHRRARFGSDRCWLVP